MIRLFHVGFPARTLLLATSEGLLIGLALLVAALGGGRGDPMRGDPQALLRIALAAGVSIIAMYYLDLYDSSVLGNPRQAAARLLPVLGALALLLTGFYYANPRAGLGWDASILGLLLVSLAVVACRGAFLAWNRALAQPTLLFGEGALAQSLGVEIGQRPELGLKLIGYLGHTPGTAARSGALPWLGGGDELAAVARRSGAKRIVITLADRRGCWPVEALLELQAHGLRIEDGPELYEAITGRVPLTGLRASALLWTRGAAASPWRSAGKRLGSLALGVPVLAVALPVMLLTALAIRLDSPGPVIFRQRRIGLHGQPFTLYKFRSMHADADADGNFQPAQPDDARVTRVGRWLRRTRLDELPQLVNILRGDMCFVGPRPFVPNQERELVERLPFYRQRWVVRPGATGWAQIHRGYCATIEDNAEKLSYDLFYVKNMSLGLDLLILFQTLKIVLLGRGGR